MCGTYTMHDIDIVPVPGMVSKCKDRLHVTHLVMASSHASCSHVCKLNVSLSHIHTHSHNTRTLTHTNSFTNNSRSCEFHSTLHLSPHEIAIRQSSLNICKDGGAKEIHSVCDGRRNSRNGNDSLWSCKFRQLLLMHLSMTSPTPPPPGWMGK